ncbi:MAG: protease complex subunit PrcB family protein [Deltaproteobacteria bacterium]|nr:protease complex subunit PrcB family protein [Deltaproteobacteria bacterium]
MKRTSAFPKLGLLAPALASLSLAAGCNTIEDPDDLDEEVEVQLASLDTEPKADHLNIPFIEFSDVTEGVGEAETRKVLTTPRAYEATFGHPAPAEVNWDKEWVVYYSAGLRSTGGYEASIQNIRRSASGYLLKITTSLSSPGKDCAVTDAFTKPDVLARFPRPRPRPQRVRYFRDDVVKDCTKPGPFCGGIAGFECPGEGTCVDDPSDDCDPRIGADCGGICQCNANAACLAGFRWDGSPEVCACVPAEPQCKADTDCRLFDNYCVGAACTCMALPAGAPVPLCPISDTVACIAQPCAGKAAACENGACVVVEGKYCEYNGRRYKVGESFPADDGCNRCSCLESGFVACTERACPVECDYNNYNKKWLSKSFEECTRMGDYMCVDGTKSFVNSCGCGCEQPADCPEWINCMPPRDCSAERARCPFSQVAW